MAVTANITVSFGADGGAAGDGHLSAEVDNRATGLNGGNTQFEPGDTAYFLVFRSDNVRIDSVQSSAGSIIGATVGTVTREEDLSFADVDSATLRVPASGITSIIWLGRSLGGLSLQADGVTVKTSARGVGVARVTYTAKNVHAYGLAAPSSVAGLTDFSILVFVAGSISG